MTRTNPPPHAVIWVNVLDHWRSVVLPVAPDLPRGLFQTVPIAADTDVDQQLAWWPRTVIADEQRALQWRALRRRSVDMNFYHQPAGIAETLWQLWQCETVEQIAAVLLGASLHPWTYSMHRPRRWLACWPPHDDVEQLESWIRVAATFHGVVWHHASPEVLPVVDERNALDCYGATERPRMTLLELVDLFARDHAALLTAWQAVAVMYTPDGDPSVVAHVTAELQQEQDAAAAQRRARDATRAEEARRRAAWEAQHPRWGEWPPSDDELQTLVWSMPTTDLAALFGVSDVAIGKRCTKGSIPKPPPGFWRKVATHALPHPGGTPPKTATTQSRTRRSRTKEG